MKKKSIPVIITIALVIIILTITLTLLALFFFGLFGAPLLWARNGSGYLTALNRIKSNMNNIPVQNAVTHNGIEEAKIIQVGNHTYYAENLFNRPSATKKEQREIIKVMELIDAGLDKDMYIHNYIYDPDTKEFLIFAHLYVDGVVISNYYFRADDITYSYQPASTDPIPDFSNLTFSGYVVPADFIDEVYAAANKNRNSLYFDYTNEIYGDITLKYDVETNLLFYECQINEYSTITVDAYSGEIIQEYYFDGVYMD